MHLGTQGQREGIEYFNQLFMLDVGMLVQHWYARPEKKHVRCSTRRPYAEAAQQASMQCPGTANLVKKVDSLCILPKKKFW